MTEQTAKNILLAVGAITGIATLLYAAGIFRKRPVQYKAKEDMMPEGIVQMTMGEMVVAATNIVLAELMDSVPLTRLLPVVGKIHDLLLKGRLPAAPHYSPRHFKDALTWVERNTPDGVALVARALSKTGSIQQ